jgi:hypothetical protein
MTYICNIHNVADREAIEAECTLERVDEDVGPQIAEMLWQINCRSA